ncbi:OsmC family protein [Oxyplasma meridianum]|uniref:OsmC family protein n=1 Tax=Oxyplasma meridianum TaxID=3073602 RepID=A0AAX4NG60_9ARCH
MEVSFKLDATQGFQTTTLDKDSIYFKNSISGQEKHYSPTEMLLLAMGTCSSDDVVSILKKMRINPDSYNVTVYGERNDEHPKILKFVNITYDINGKVDPLKVKKAINLSLTKYCSVSIIVNRGGADLRYTLIVNGEKIEDRVKPELVDE